MKYLPKIVAMVTLWGIVAGIIYYVDPVLLRDVVIPGVYSPLLLAVFAAAWYSAAVILQKPWRALGLASLLVGGILLSMLQLMYPLLGAVIVAAAVVLVTFRT